VPELRKDPITGRWVIISTERGRRPTSFASVTRREDASLCPFCPGHEEATPPEILAYREPGSEPNHSGWRLRVMPNKYPALVVEGSMSREPHGIYDKMNGIGAHEVIIETPDHGLDMMDMTDEAVRDVFWAYRERMMDLERDRRFQYILVFKNHGQAAGASLEHAHSQLIATPIIPKRVAEELTGAKRYFDFKERCIFCDIVRQEIADQERLVADYDAFLSLQPFAPRFPFETWIVPKTHAHAPGLQRVPRVLSLAYRDHPQADPGGRFRMGVRVLYQYHDARGVGSLPARSRSDQPERRWLSACKQGRGVR